MKIKVGNPMHSTLSLSRIIRILFLTLIFPTLGLAENICEKGLSNNPMAAIESGIGGTGAVMTRSGIGGTGIDSAPVDETSNREGGIGGTGSQVVAAGGVGGTGIVGVITGFASICVNGIEIHYDTDTPVTVDGQPATPRDLAIGQVVNVRAQHLDDKTTARHIAVVHAIVGPIDSIDTVTGELQILNQVVLLGQKGGMEKLKAGKWIQVSGFYAQNKILATRIDLSRSDEEARINGIVTQVDADGFYVGDTRIEFDQQPQLAEVKPGTEIALSGHWDSNSIQVQHAQVNPTYHNLGQVTEVVMAGYWDVTADSGEINLGGQAVQLDTDLQTFDSSSDDDILNQLVTVQGKLDEGQIVVNSVELSDTTFGSMSTAGLDEMFGVPEDLDGQFAAEPEPNQEVFADEGQELQLGDESLPEIDEMLADPTNPELEDFDSFGFPAGEPIDPLEPLDDLYFQDESTLLELESLGVIDGLNNSGSSGKPDPEIPIDPVIDPVDPEVIPIDPVIDPIDPEIIPIDPIIDPVDPEVIPIDPVIGPIDPEVIPIDPEVIPIDPEIFDGLDIPDWKNDFDMYHDMLPDHE